MSYTRNPFWQWENDVSSAAVGTLMAVIVTAAAILLSLSLILLKDLWRIYHEHAMDDPNSTTSRVLWVALAAFVGVLLLSGVLAITPATAAVAGYIAAWGFLLFVVVVEFAAHAVPRAQNPEGGEGLVLGKSIG